MAEILQIRCKHYKINPFKLLCNGNDEQGSLLLFSCVKVNHVTVGTIMFGCNPSHIIILCSMSDTR